MLQPYLTPVGYAFLSFPVAALLCTLPFLIVQYRKYGYINKLRSFLLYLFLLYMLNALFLVVLPFPDSRHNLPSASGTYTQLIPFQFIADFLRETSVVFEQPSTYWYAFKERAVLQVVFNVMLTVPFGMFMRYYARFTWLKCLLAAFLLSLFFEVTQLTAIYGFFDYPYRVFDVDDLFLNTLGGIVGYILASWLSALLPRMDRLDDGIDLTTKRVSYTRRAIALLFDSMVLFLTTLILAILGLEEIVIAVVIGYFIFVPYWTNGQTLGKMIVRIRIVGQGERLKLSEIALRNGLLYGWWGLNLLFSAQLDNSVMGWLQTVGAFIVFIGNLILLVHVLACLFNHGRQLLHERVSHTRHAIVVPERLKGQREESVS